MARHHFENINFNGCSFIIFKAQKQIICNFRHDGGDDEIEMNDDLNDDTLVNNEASNDVVINNTSSVLRKQFKRCHGKCVQKFCLPIGNIN